MNKTHITETKLLLELKKKKSPQTQWISNQSFQKIRLLRRSSIIKLRAEAVRGVGVRSSQTRRPLSGFVARNCKYRTA